MTYRLLRQDARPDLWQVAFGGDLPVDALRAGLPIDRPAGPWRATLASAADPPSDLLEFPCPLVSDAMRQALVGAGVDTVQFFPVRLDEQYGDGAVVAEYWAMNVLGAVACAAPLEERAAGGELAEGRPAPFRIDPARTFALDLFRLAEDRRLLVVSARVAAALGAAGLRGVVLQDPATYDGRRVSTAPPPDAIAADAPDGADGAPQPEPTAEEASLVDGIGPEPSDGL